MQLLLRALGAITIMIAIVNVNVKKVFIDEIRPKAVYPLAFRSF